MSDIESAAPAPPSRPTVVSAAAVLMVGVAVLVLVIAVLPLPWAGKVATTAKSAYANLKNGDQVATAVTASIYIGLVVDIIGAVAFAVLASLVLRGNNKARIVTWVLGGVGVLCCGGGLAIRGAASNIGQNGTDAAAMQDAQKQLNAVYPSWYNGVQTTLTLLAVVALLVVIVLLALPVAHPYFSRARAQYVDPALPALPYPTIGEPPVPPTPQADPPATPPAPPAQRDE